MTKNADTPPMPDVDTLRELYVARFVHQDPERVRKRFDMLWAIGKIEAYYDREVGWFVTLR